MPNKKRAAARRKKRAAAIAAVPSKPYCVDKKPRSCILAMGRRYISIISMNLNLKDPAVNSGVAQVLLSNIYSLDLCLIRLPAANA